jgi:hypothetical protein
LEEGFIHMNAKYLQMLKNALSLMKKNDELKVSSDERVQELESQVKQLEFDKDVLDYMVISRDSIIYELEEAGYYAPVDNAPDVVLSEADVMHLVAHNASIVQAHHVDDELNSPFDAEQKQ